MVFYLVKKKVLGYLVSGQESKIEYFMQNKAQLIQGQLTRPFYSTGLNRTKVHLITKKLKF
jgi:hypothetical protein